jgi:hypothetical protein
VGRYGNSAAMAGGVGGHFSVFQDKELEGVNLTLDHSPQGWQILLNGIPHVTGGDILIIVPIYIARTCHLLPRDSRMSRF